MIKNSSILLFLMFSFTYLIIYAQPYEPLEKSVFWEISGNGLEKPSYLFGTIHVMPKSEFVRSKKLDQKLKKSDLLVLEMQVDVPLKEQIRWTKIMMLPGGQTIESYLDDKQKNRLKSLFIDSLEISEKKYETYIRFKPLMLYSFILVETIGKPESYELYFSKYAKKNKVEVFGLESFEYQLSLFDSISMEDQIEMFFGNDFITEMDTTLDMYKSQDIEKMASSMKDGDDNASLEYDLIIKRNQNWIMEFEKLLQQKSLFIAVGAGHLGGPKGLISLLKAKGYTLKALKI